MKNILLCLLTLIILSLGLTKIFAQENNLSSGKLTSVVQSRDKVAYADDTKNSSLIGIANGVSSLISYSLF